MPTFTNLANVLNKLAKTNLELTQDLENLQDELSSTNARVSHLEQRVSALECAYLTPIGHDMGPGDSSGFSIYGPAGGISIAGSAARSSRSRNTSQKTYKHLHKFG